jgi:glutamate synthase domain-containing protein 1/glutamate synthase domain-containing protein 3
MTERTALIDRIIGSRRELGIGREISRSPEEAEGGCGVVGLISTVQISGKHILTPLLQMHNRGNGKGGGVAAVGLDPKQAGVKKDFLDSDYLIQIAYLDPASRSAVEKEFIDAKMTVHARSRIGPEYGGAKGEQGVYHPEVWRYFCRVKPAVLSRFMTDSGHDQEDLAKVEDEFVYQNSFKLNEKYYASLGEKKAFVLSHGKNLFVFKIVGYAEEAIRYYGLEEVKAHLWIGHQRYPTKGRVWHPGGAHPFVGLHEALVHNGDFANYYSVAQYLAQRNIRPLFLTDTEVSVLLFDLLRRVYGYPLEYVIEALAPTTERDFTMLPEEKQRVYRRIQISHMQGSPDGPWFFIIGRNDPVEEAFRLIGITDTSMLRPQVFALQRGVESIGLIASEKQAIDATLESLAAEDKRFWPKADKYWNARGGSYTDGGAFIFSLPRKKPSLALECVDKFGREISDGEFSKPPIEVAIGDAAPKSARRAEAESMALPAMKSALSKLDQGKAAELIASLASGAGDDDAIEKSASLLTSLLDDRYPLGALRRSFVSEIALQALYRVFDSLPSIGAKSESRYRRLRRDGMTTLKSPAGADCTLAIDATGFAAEGDDGLSRAMVSAYGLGWKGIVIYRTAGQRFIGSGIGKESAGLRIDVYGSSGDYIASGLDGAEIYVHANAQDQVAQIINGGKLVVYGDVGQAFMYGAKGSEAYIRGNAAGRPLINAVGRPRVVINGTALDYLAESFMAGDPMSGGGFVILNGMQIDGDGGVTEQESPYPGGNLFSLASGGAIFVRDPDGRLGEEQLNGGEFVPFTQADWELIKPYLEQNEKLFGISIEKHLLVHGGRRLAPEAVYRKVRPLQGKSQLTPIGLE